MGCVHVKVGLLGPSGLHEIRPKHFARKGTAHAVRQLDTELRKYIHIENTCFINVCDGGCLNYDEV